MSKLWSERGSANRHGYEDESDLERAVERVKKDLFGEGRFYLPIKRIIGIKGGVRNVPDGYLIDLRGKRPQLYVVEIELASHDPLRHVAVQLLQFSISFDEDRQGVKRILFEGLEKDIEARNACEIFVAVKGFRNLDHMLADLVENAEFRAVVVIDEASDELEGALLSKFQFVVEVLELVRYEWLAGEQTYRYTPFLEDVEVDASLKTVRSPSTKLMQSGGAVDVEVIDTIVVPARDEGFEQVFLKENRWYQIRIHGAMRPLIKYIASYRVDPTSAITHLAPVRSIEPWGTGGKFVVNFAEPAHPIRPVKLISKEEGGRVRAPQASRYTVRNRLEEARTLDDLWAATEYV